MQTVDQAGAETPAEKPEAAQILRTPQELQQEREICIAAHYAILNVANQCNIALRLMALHAEQALPVMVEAGPMLHQAIVVLRTLELSRMAPANGSAA